MRPRGRHDPTGLLHGGRVFYPSLNEGILRVINNTTRDAAMPLNYMNDLGQARAHALVREKRRNASAEDPATGCWLSTGSANNDGYCQVSSAAAAASRPPQATCQLTMLPFL